MTGLPQLVGYAPRPATPTLVEGQQGVMNAVWDTWVDPTSPPARATAPTSDAPIEKELARSNHAAQIKTQQNRAFRFDLHR